MAMRTGKRGVVTWSGGDTAEVTSWSLDLTADTVDATAMDASGNYKTYLATWNDWTASVEVNASSPSISGIGTLASLSLTDGTTTFSITASDNDGAICTGISFTTDHADVVKATYSFQGSGQITAS